MPRVKPAYQDFEGNPISGDPGGDRPIPPDENWIDLETLKEQVEWALARAKDRTELTAEQRRLADANEGLAIRFATIRWRKAKRCGITFDKVVCAAKLGLEDAAALFDPAKGKLGPYAWGFMMRRVVELHESHDLGGDDEERDPSAIGRANRWDLGRFAWPEYPDVVRGLRRMAATPGAPFTDQDLDILENRAGENRSQVETAARLGLTLSAVRRIERRAAERVGPVAERLRETSTDRYLLSVLSPDEILRIYGRETPIPQQRAWLDERDRRHAALDAALDRQGYRWNYGRNCDTDADPRCAKG